MNRSKSPFTILITSIELTSEAFEHNGYIPKKYTCDGKNVNPPLGIGKLPERTKSLVLIVDDPDAPGRPWTHWLVWNILPTSKFDEDCSPGEVGRNDFGKNRYDGPCPSEGTHNYHFKIFALNDFLELKSQVTKVDLEEAMSAHVIAFGELIGRYKRQKN